MKYLKPVLLSLVWLGFGLASSPAAAADEKPDRAVSLAGGKLQLTAPPKWEKKQPRNRIVEYEFAVPKSEGDEEEGRVTLMGAGGSVEANLDRWIKQFSQPDGADSKDRAKLKEQKAAGTDLHLLDISGTYDDKPPFSGQGVERKGYRMLAVVIASKELGNYFIKFYGPQRTVSDNEKAFQAMIDSLERK
jgi:hypothetical protein